MGRCNMHADDFLYHDDELGDMQVQYTVVSPAYPGRYYGPPEDCYPAESAEIEIGASAILDGYGNMHLFSPIGKLCEALETAAYEHLESKANMTDEDFSIPDDYEDRYWDSIHNDTRHDYV
jgi:hypothetical protein